MSGCKVRLLLAFTNCLDENINQLSDVRTPFLIIHGSEDRLCNPVGSELLFRYIYASISKPALVLYKSIGGHRYCVR